MLVTIVILSKNHTSKKKDIQKIVTVNISHPDDFSLYKRDITLLILNYHQQFNQRFATDNDIRLNVLQEYHVVAA